MTTTSLIEAKPHKEIELINPDAYQTYHDNSSQPETNTQKVQRLFLESDITRDHAINVEDENTHLKPELRVRQYTCLEVLERTGPTLAMWAVALLGILYICFMFFGIPLILKLTDI